MIVDADDATRKGGNLSEGNKDGFVNLALWSKPCADEQEYDTCEW